MSTQVRKLGWVEADRTRGKRVALTTNTGGTILVVPDPNKVDATVPNYGDKTNVQKIYIYESTNSAKTTWALRATVTAPAGKTFTGNGENMMSADLFTDNSIGIAYRTTDGSLYWSKVTYTTWAVATAELIATNAGSLTWQCLDVSISDGNAVLVHAMYTTPTSGNYAKTRTFLRRTSLNTWAQIGQQDVTNTVVAKAQSMDVSCTWIPGGAATSREYAYAHTVITSGVDAGTLVFRTSVNEQTGTAAAVETALGTFSKNDLPKDFNTPLKARSIMLFPSGVGEFTMSTQTFYTHPKFGVARWRKVSGVWTLVTPYTSYTSTSTATTSFGGMTQTYGSDVLTFITNARTTNSTTWDLEATLVRFDRSNDTAAWGAGFFYFDNLQFYNTYFPQGGTGRNYNFRNHDVVMAHRTAGSGYELQHAFISPMRAPATVSPRSGEVSTTSIPALTADADLDRQYGQGRIKIRWDFAKDSNFVTSLRTFVQSDSKYQKVDLTGSSGKVVRFTDKLPTSLSLEQGTWWVRAAHVNEYGLVSSFTAAQSFTVSHPPSATDLSPSGAKTFVYGSGSREFLWKFSDPSNAGFNIPENDTVDDFQTAYQIVIERTSDNTVVVDTGKIDALAPGHVEILSPTLKDVELKWKVRLWDRDDVAGEYSSYSIFTVVDGPSVAITAPTNGQVLISAIPAITFTPTVGGTRTINKYRVLVTKGPALVHDSGFVAVGNLSSGTPITYAPDKVVYTNHESYTVTVRVTDNVGLEGSSQVAITTNWIVPPGAAGLIVDKTPFNVENQGYISVFWDDTQRDADFIAWDIMRKDDIIDPATLAVLEEGVWQELAFEYTPAEIYEYRDYYAPSGYRVQYRVIQIVDRFGDQVASENTNTYDVFPMSDGYWLIEPRVSEIEASAFKLSIVTSDSYTDEWESETYNIIGGGRHVDRGEHLGLSGSLNVQIRNNGGTTARQKKIRLEVLKAENREVYLRTPFGDLYRVSIGNLGIGRIAGVGRDEFVDVTMPYTEVGE